MLSFGFTLLFTAFATGSQVAEIVFKSYKDEHGVELNAYTGSVVLYIVFAFSNWFAPSLISVIGAKGRVLTMKFYILNYRAVLVLKSLDF